MLKRYQVMLPDWLADYTKYAASKYDLSFSEIIRTVYCFTVLVVVTNLYPEYKPGFTLKEIFNFIQKIQPGQTERDEMHRFLSKIYFEARKAIEYRMAQEKKTKKK